MCLLKKKNDKKGERKKMKEKGTEEKQKEEKNKTRDEKKKKQERGLKKKLLARKPRPLLGGRPRLHKMSRESTFVCGEDIFNDENAQKPPQPRKTSEFGEKKEGRERK